MKKLWLRIAGRIDSSSLRERAIIFAAAALLVIAFAETAALQPEFASQRRLAGDLAQRQAELKELQQQIAKLVQDRDADPDKALRARVEDLRTSIEQAERRVATEQARFTEPAQMKRVVEELLAKNKRIRLVDLKTLQVQSVAEAREQDARPASATARSGPAATAERQIFRHGIEITVTGSYLDLLAYISELERLPTQLYWSSIEMVVSQYPVVTAKLKIYTLSLDKAWMNV